MRNWQKVWKNGLPTPSGEQHGTDTTMTEAELVTTFPEDDPGEDLEDLASRCMALDPQTVKDLDIFSTDGEGTSLFEFCKVLLIFTCNLSIKIVFIFCIKNTVNQ